jgi:hypothetical protein
MSKRKKRIIQPINEVEIINRRTRRLRKINFENKELVIYNKELNEFQLLSISSSSYDDNSEPKHG